MAVTGIWQAVMAALSLQQSTVSLLTASQNESIQSHALHGFA